MSEELRQISQIPLDTLDDESDKKIPNRNRRKWLISILYKVQKYSAYTFVSFLGIHLTSVILIPVIPSINANVKNEVFSMAKAVYGLPFFEPIVIIGSVSTHVVSGLGLRFIKKKHKTPINNNRDIYITDNDDDIGFGGISSIFGLGYKKSITSRLFNLNPLQFSGYMIIPLLMYHYYKFKYIPVSIEGDSSMVNLDYIKYVLNFKYPYFNVIMLNGLVWSMSYHLTNGLFKLKKLFSKKWKRVGLVMVNTLGILGTLSVYMYKKQSMVDDFMGKTFIQYLNSYRI